MAYYYGGDPRGNNPSQTQGSGSGYGGDPRGRGPAPDTGGGGGGGGGGEEEIPGDSQLEEFGGNQLALAMPFDPMGINAMLAGRQQKAALKWGAGQTEKIGKQAAAAYGQAGTKAMGYYDPATGEYQTGRQAAPWQQGDWYQTNAGTLHGPGRMGTRYDSGASRLPASSLQGLIDYRNMTGQRPSNRLRDIYNNYPNNTPHALKDAAPGMKDRLFYPSDYWKDHVYDLKRFTHEKSAMDYRDQELHDDLNRQTESGNMGREMARFDPSAQGSAVGRDLRGTRFDNATGSLFNDIRGGNSKSGALSRDITSGTTGSGQLLRDIASRNTEAGRTMNTLGNNEIAQQLGRNVTGDTLSGNYARDMQSGRTRLGGYINDLTPGETAALGETYDRLKGEQPTYEENFFTSQLNGDNPYFNRLKEMGKEEARNSAAARGSFASGHAMQNERRAGADIDAAAFKHMGDLAAQAGTARRARLGQQLEGAQSLDDLIEKQRQYKGNLLQTQEGKIADLFGQNDERASKLAEAQAGTRERLALGSDTLRGNTIGNRETLLGQLAGHQDTNMTTLAGQRDQLEADRWGKIADLAAKGDTNAIQMMANRATNAKDQDMIHNDKMAAITGLSKDRGKEAIDKMDLVTKGIEGLTADERGRLQEYRNFLGNLDTGQREDNRDLANIGQLADTQDRGDLAHEEGVAKDIDAGNIARGTYENNSAVQGDTGQLANISEGGRLAAGASGERAATLAANFDRAAKLGDAKSAISAAMDMAAIGAMSASQLKSLDLLLERAGVDSKTRAQIQSNTANNVNILGKIMGSLFGGG